MVENISKSITQYFINNNIIDENQKEACEYSMHTRIMKIIFIITIMCIALIRANVIETIVFLYIALSLRRRTGGYHAKSELICFVLSIIITFVSVEMIAPALNNISIIFKCAIYLFSVLALLIFAPVNHPNLDMSQREIKLHRGKMENQIYILSLIIIILELLKMSSIANLLIAGGLMVSISVVISKIIKQEVQSDEQI